MHAARKVGAANILIVEDEALAALYTSSLLADLGHQVTGIAPSADAALRAADEQTPDLVLMDITLRGPVDGIETAAQLQQRHELQIVFVTAHADAATRTRAQALQPAGYLLKPFGLNQLRETIDRALTGPGA